MNASTSLGCDRGVISSSSAASCAAVLPASPLPLPVAPGVTAAPQGQQPKTVPATRKEIQRTKSEQADLDRFIETVRRGNPYRLDRTGALDLPGLGVVPLAGLTVLQATQRLAIEPFLREFRIRLILLPLEPVDTDALKPFGYDLFAGVPTTFAPVTDVPVPSEYVIGPGDRFDVQLIGNTKGKHSLVVNRDGRINFPELGPIAVSGLRVGEAKARIEQRVADQMIGTQVTVSMGDLRSIRVFVVGEANQPGSYTVSSLATVTNALFVSGGVKPIGSLRNIQLKRNGRLVQRLDLYDLLLNGDTSADVRLLPGDVIFIPPVGSTVGVTGEIRRPAIYELKGESSAADLLYLGGGLTPAADPALARIERIDERRDRVVVDVNLSHPEGRGTLLKSGDLMTIPGTRPADYLRVYATRFDCVEVDSTYYRTPAARTVDGWVEKTPAHFRLAAKFPRAIVHAGEGALPDASRLLTPEATYAERDRFLDVMGRLGARLGPLVLQFPYFSKKCFASAA